MAEEVRKDLGIGEQRNMATELRRHVVRMLERAGSGHPGGSLSAVEFITALYFGGFLEYDAARPEWPERDRFILSKGHGVPALYAALAEAGYIPVAELDTLREIDSRLQGHPVYGTAPGIEASTGSLGQGLSIGLGIALAGMLDRKDYRVYVLLGDGECQEGQVWEAAMAAGHQRPRQPHRHRGLQQVPARWRHRGHHGLEPFAPSGRRWGGRCGRSTVTTWGR
jgi:transketolase